MTYDFLNDTYETERLKVLSVWGMFNDEDMTIRPHPRDPRGRCLLEHMVHQCVSENLWFKNMLEIDVSAPPLPREETRFEFIRRYAEDSGGRLDALRTKRTSWWRQEVEFFDVTRSRAWVMVRRLTHTAHHRGQQTALLRMLNREVYSTYGPTADTGGLMQHGAPVIYAYPDLDALLEQEAGNREKARLLGPGQNPSTERPSAAESA